MALNRAHRRMSKPLNQLWKLLALPLLLYIALPLAALIFKVSLSDLLASLSEPQVRQAITLSMVTSFITTLIALLLGTPVAYLLAQRKSNFTRLADTIIDLPTVLPPSVAGVALLMAFGRRGLLGPGLSSMGIEIPFTLVAVIMAQTFVAASYYVKAATIGYSGIDRELKQAAALDGAGNWQTFRFVALPLASTAMLSGMVMTWARALGEFGATIIFAGNFPGRTQTMPLAIYLGFEIDLSVALTLSIILIILSFFSLMIVKVFLHRQLEAEFEASDG
jgi:molybdate transport system permease protein